MYPIDYVTPVCLKIIMHQYYCSNNLLELVLVLCFNMFSYLESNNK